MPIVVVSASRNGAVLESCMPWTRPERQPHARCEHVLNSVGRAPCGSKTALMWWMCTRAMESRTSSLGAGTFRAGARLLPARNDMDREGTRVVAPFSQLCRSRETCPGVKMAVLQPCCDAANQVERRRKKTAEPVGTRSLGTFRPMIQNGECTQVCRRFLTVLSALARCASKPKFRSLQLCCVALG